MHRVVIMASNCESLCGLFDKCRLSTGWPPTLRPSQPTWTVKVEEWKETGMVNVPGIRLNQNHRAIEKNKLDRLRHPSVDVNAFATSPAFCDVDLRSLQLRRQREWSGGLALTRKIGLIGRAVARVFPNVSLAMCSLKLSLAPLLARHWRRYWISDVHQ